MRGDSWWLNVLVLALCLGGLVLLALASERQGQQWLGRAPTAGERISLRCLGWPLLGLALALCMRGWGWNIGPVAWLGWLSVAGVVLAFALPLWPPFRKPAKARLPRPCGGRRGCR